MGDCEQAKDVRHLFVNDTLLFCEPDVRIILNIRCVIMSFQAVSGLNINLAESKLVNIRYVSENIILARILEFKFSSH